MSGYNLSDDLTVAKGCLRELAICVFLGFLAFVAIWLGGHLLSMLLDYLRR